MMMNPNMERRMDLAGQTVRQGAFEVTYREDGYAFKAVLASDSPGCVVDGKTIPGEPKRTKKR